MATSTEFEQRSHEDISANYHKPWPSEKVENVAQDNRKVQPTLADAIKLTRRKATKLYAIPSQWTQTHTSKPQNPAKRRLSQDSVLTSQRQSVGLSSKKAKRVQSTSFGLVDNDNAEAPEIGTATITLETTLKSTVKLSEPTSTSTSDVSGDDAILRNNAKSIAETQTREPTQECTTDPSLQEEIVLDRSTAIAVSPRIERVLSAAPTFNTGISLPSRTFSSPAPTSPEVETTVNSSQKTQADSTTQTIDDATNATSRPCQNLLEDQRFVADVQSALKQQSKAKTLTIARRQARRIAKLLNLAAPPDNTEAQFLSGDEAEQWLQSNVYFPGIIVTEGQQPLPLQTTERFLNEYYDDSAEVWIQDPAILEKRKVPHARKITIKQLKERFLQPRSKRNIPWNCLELAAHVEDGLRPTFLNAQDCRLLTKLKLPSGYEQASRRHYDPGWKEVEKWALLAQGGALTEPHQDSHGYCTYITMNQGSMGFGWLANPTVAERQEWRANPSTFDGGQWRYIVLRPGQTVFFPAGTVHFVFRLLSEGDTLAFGGHVLRCSQIVHWIETMLEEQVAPEITNEDLTESAEGYLQRVETFVKQASKSGTAERWGGQCAIEKFLKLKARFLQGTK